MERPRCKYPCVLKYQKQKTDGGYHVVIQPVGLPYYRNSVSIIKPEREREREREKESNREKREKKERERETERKPQS